MFSVLFAMTALGVILLHHTPGFQWADLRRGLDRINWRFAILFGALTTLACLGVILMLNPDQLFNIARARPLMLGVILLFYPLLSALPQELIFRPLFFRRYGTILPAGSAAIVLNAALFSMAHLMYWSWVVAVMTFFGGLAFAHAYERRGNFAQAVLLHAIAGNLIFTFGLGIYFYSGNVVRPF